MNRRSSLRLLAGVTGLILALALMVMEPRGRPRDQLERPSGPSAVEEGGQNQNVTVRGPGSGVRGPSSGKRFRTPNSESQTPLGRPLRSNRPPAKRTAEAARVKRTAQKEPNMGVPSPDPTRPPPRSSHLPEAAVPEPADGRLVGDPPPAGPPSETSDPGLSPPPPVLKQPVLLTEPTQDGGDQQVALERGQLTTQLRLEAREGRVVLRILVRADGTVARAEVARSSGQSALDQAAVLAVGSWRFDPATRNGAPIEAWVLIPVRFVIR